MPVTDLQVATLRALLMRDIAEHKRLIEQLGNDGMRDGYFPLVTGAFMEAVEERFDGKSQRDMVEWVAKVRAERDPEGLIDPGVAERLILWAFESASTEGIDFQTSYGHQTMLLGLIVEEQGLDEPGLDSFLQKAREFTNGMLERRKPT